MSWNVENLFDCHDDTLKDDGEFLPESERRWTPARYWRKQDQLARTIAAVEPQNGWPMLVGMMEVENDSVLFDLTRRSPLRRAGYDFLVTQRPDVRGIDVAVLDQPKRDLAVADQLPVGSGQQQGFCGVVKQLYLAQP